MEEKERTEEPGDDRPSIEEVVTKFGDVHVRSGFILEELGSDVWGISLVGPLFEFVDDDESDDEGKQE